MKKSIRVRFTLIFVGVTTLIIALCIGLNVFLLEGYYLQNKKDKTIQEIDKMNQVLTQTDESELDSKILEVLTEMRDVYGIVGTIIGGDGEVKYSSMADPERLIQRLKFYIFQDLPEDSVIDRTVLYENENPTYKIISLKDKNTGSGFVDSWGYLADGNTFIFSTTIESIKNSAAISNRFFAIIGISAVFISAIGIFFATKRMTKPIQELSAISEKMAKLDFKAKYAGQAKDEIGVLGTSINNLSTQLESTITKLQEANVRLTKDIEEKIQIDDMRKEFLSNVSHELKTPIALIQGYAEGLQDCINDDPESREFYCEVIIDEANKMNQMVQKLLSLNHLEFGTDSVEFTPFSMKEMIEGVIQSTNIMAEQKECAVTFKSCDDALMVYADEFRMEEVIRNFISNAINHVDDCDVIPREIKIYAELSPNDENKYRIRVFNTGSFIPENELEKVWIKFYKVDKARTREYGGSGIGLSIVKAIMDLHHCDYGVRNVDGGVEFWMEVNRYKE
ncbi:ATP-binding region, ATPase-like:Histidine kinase, HAMP region:Histidine kinase A-like protein [Lachnospiraceae bacterium TWA4]|nr:ATP-binding region, ATPase-like:Histidine kinase, HAMP region:Histidine kinase A-like protein [Lachnospiraceae bacterium TWA4]